ncbi:MAG: lectin-like protein, partial [Phycisphaerales bacterium]
MGLAALGAALAVADASHAQAVQWRTQDGGNGHWYRARVIPIGTSSQQARAMAAASGGYLASITSAGEGTLIRSLVGTDGPCWTNGHGPWLGGFRDRQTGIWTWTTGEAWTYNAWCSNQPSGDACPDPEETLCVKLDQYCSSGQWWGDIT